VCILCHIIFVPNTIIIDYLNKNWNSFQISFHFAQGFTINTIWEQIWYIFFLIYLGWWILSWLLKYLHIIYAIFNIYSFSNFIPLCARIYNQYHLRTNMIYFFLIYLGWWILSWLLKYLHIIYAIFNIYSFVTLH
jgi:hypothetical protein